MFGTLTNPLKSCRHKGGGRADRHAFSLIEMLVVMAVVSLLISILMPSLRSARAKARTTKCASQLDQIGNAFLTYSDEHHEFFPYPINTTSAMVFGGRSGTLAGYNDAAGFGADDRALNEYVGFGASAEPNADVPLFHCPSDVGRGDINTPSTYYRVGSSYAYNSYSPTPVIPTLRGIKYTRVSRPSFTVMAGDHMTHNWLSPGGGHSERLQRWHHPTRVLTNILYVDTHVDLIEMEPTNETDDYTFLPY